MTRVVFTVGGGPWIGRLVAEAFMKGGIGVAIGSRNPDREVLDNASIAAVSIDAKDIASINNAFEKIKSELGIPNVIG
jgi:NAD(P)-dependent dehydrogenase (short-subunit alcohol dehydrogenase family)